jgi:hypothetical protein
MDVRITLTEINTTEKEENKTHKKTFFFYALKLNIIIEGIEKESVTLLSSFNCLNFE